ncbi:MAG: DNA polymerase III subunit alpha [Candidatus Makana argininalis]
MLEPKFVHLRVHSDHSMIDGIIKINSLIKKAIDLKMPSIAITDFFNLCGLIKFYKQSYNEGIKPIFGADILLYNNILENEISELTILASNNTGYKNLISIISDAYKNGYNINGPIINKELLIKYNEGLILISGAKNGDLGKCLIRNNLINVSKCLLFYNKYFLNRYYIELIRTDRHNEEYYISLALNLSQKYGFPLLATNDVRFIKSSDFEIYKIKIAINKGITINEYEILNSYSSKQYMRSEKEMLELFSDIPESLTNTVEIAKKCNVTIKLGKYHLPIFKTNKISNENYLISCAKKGLKKKLLYIFPKKEIRYTQKIIYKKRLKSELKIINKMKFASYFLIVMDFIKWAKNKNIPVGPGRGSGAGSLVAYALNITDINPINFDLLFERFLNPERISMPDFDIDFCMEKRDKVIDYISLNYGKDYVSQIITFGTMTAKAVIKDVGRVLGHPYSFVNKISKLIPNDYGINIDKALIKSSQFKLIYDNNAEVKILINIAKKLEGTIRNFGKHSGGVVIAPSKITDFSPIYCDSYGKNIITQFDKDDIESIGLVKFDFLGLRTLTVINKTLLLLNSMRLHKKLTPIKLKYINLNDKKIFNILKKSETTAIFQLESKGMKDLIKRLKPDCFEDIIALVALFRPGPLQSGMVEKFISRKHGRESIFYPSKKWQHNSLRSILHNTYGVILYQEQVMKIAQILAGYTLEKSDILRIAMVKKNKYEMNKQRYFFKKGSIKNGIDSKLSMKIFDILEKFSSYGFNKSHSTAYALITYQTLWLKTYFPSEFLSSVMTSDIDNTEKIIEIVQECFRIGIKVLPPNINISEYHFTVNKDGNIIYGMGAIKGIGKNTVNLIINSRNKNGNFLGIFDLCSRLNIKKVNKSILEKLIFSGSLDCFGISRYILINLINYLLKASNQHIKNNFTCQSDMFGILYKNSTYIKKLHKFSKINNIQTILDGEIKTLGFYLTSHPILIYLQEIKYFKKITYIKNIQENNTNNIIKTIGLIIFNKTKRTKNGNIICNCIIDDRYVRLELILFKNTFMKYSNLIVKNKIIIVTGKIFYDKFNFKFKMNVYKINDINTEREKYAKRLKILIKNITFNEHLIYKIKSYIKECLFGSVPLYFYYNKNNKYNCFYFLNKYKIKPTNNLINNFKKIFGSENVNIEY